MRCPSVKEMLAGAFVAAATLVVLFYGTDEARSQQPGHFAPLPQTAKAPEDNATSSQKIVLGRVLFWDPILSGHRDVACATCHHPRFGYAENLDVSIGVSGVGLGSERQFTLGGSIPFVKRNSQPILNTAFNGMDEAGRYDPSRAPMFWDLRATSLEAQALEPVKTFEEMRGDAYPEDRAVASVVARLQGIAEYRSLFAAAFREDPAVNAANLGKALASFQRSLVANNAPFDRYMRGDASAMTGEQIRGMRRFERVGCINCHNGPMFSDYKPHVLGVPDNQKLPTSDKGIKDTYAFRTASLRNLAYTAPYMHSGAFGSLERVLNFYDDVQGRRGERNRNANLRRDQLDPLLQRLRGVDDDEGALIAFLNALNDDSFDKTVPSRVPSGLHPGGSIQ